MGVFGLLWVEGAGARERENHRAARDSWRTRS
jgi:hypothetical protein